MAVQSPAPGAGRFTLRLGEAIALGGLLLLLISTFLKVDSLPAGVDGSAGVTIWHAAFAPAIFAVLLTILFVALAVLGDRLTVPPRFQALLVALPVIGMVLVTIFWIAQLIAIHGLFTLDGSGAGPGLSVTFALLSLIGVVAATIGVLGELAIPGLDKVLLPTAPKPAKAASAPQPPGLGQPAQQPGQSWGVPATGAYPPAGPAYPSQAPAQPEQQSAFAPPSYQQPSYQPPTFPAPETPAAPVQEERRPAYEQLRDVNPEASSATMMGLPVTSAEPAAPPAPAAPAPAAAPPFQPYWAGVTAPVPSFSPEHADQRVGSVNPGAWYLVTGEHPAGVIVEVDGSPVLVRDPGQLVRY